MQYPSLVPYDSLADERIIQVVVAESTLIHCQLLSEAMKRDRYIRVLGAVCSSKNLLHLAGNSAVDVALVSSNLDEDSSRGFEVIRELRLLRPGMRIVMLLESSQRETVVEVFRAGARGVFSKSEPLKHLCKCVRCVHLGQIWASSTELAFALEALARVPEIRFRDNKGINLLSKREIEVVQSVAEGLTNRDIGQRLNLSRHTIKNHLLRIFDKLGVSNRTELLFLALSQGEMAGKDQSNQDLVESCRKVAKKGVAAARLELADRYRPRAGVTRDPVSAYMRCLLSERAQAEIAEQISRVKKSLADAMTPEQLQEAEGRAAGWPSSAKPPARAVLDNGEVRPFSAAASVGVRRASMS